MKTVTFDVGTQPWDDVYGQIIEGSGVGPAPGWQDAMTGADFTVILGRMSVALVPNYPTKRHLILRPVSGGSDHAILRVRFPTSQSFNFVRFRLGCEMGTATATIGYYSYPSYGTGGRPPEKTRLREITVQPAGGATVEYRYVCFPVTEVWITIVEGLNNWVDTVEFDYVQHTWLERVLCRINRIFYAPVRPQIFPASGQVKNGEVTEHIRRFQALHG